MAVSHSHRTARARHRTGVLLVLVAAAASFVLSVALWWALGNAIGRGWSAVVVAVIWAIVAAILAAVGRSELKKIRGLDRTADSVKKIPPALKGNEEANR